MSNQKPSKTAFYNALHRALAYKMVNNETLGKDNLAKIFLPGYYRFFLNFTNIQKSTKRKLDNAFPGLNAYVTARTAFFDQLFTDALIENIPQIIILGAGYDSRPYRYVELNTNTHIFELDIPITQSNKKKCLKKAGIKIPEQVTFVPIDLNQVTLAFALGSSGFQNSKKTLFLWEGASYYLDPESVEKIINFFSSLTHKGNLLALDYMISINDENADEFYGARAFFQSMREEHSDEALRFSINEEEIIAYLDQRGLNLVEHMDPEEIEKRYLMDEQGLINGRITGHFRFLLAKPKE